MILWRTGENPLIVWSTEVKFVAAEARQNEITRE